MFTFAFIVVCVFGIIAIFRLLLAVFVSSNAVGEIFRYVFLVLIVAFGIYLYNAYQHDTARLTAMDKTNSAPECRHDRVVGV